MRTLILRILLMVSVMFACVNTVSAVQFQETRLGRLPLANIDSEDNLRLWSAMAVEMEANGFSVEAHTCITDGHGFHLAAVVPTPEGKCYLWLDGRKGPVYDQIRHAIRGAYTSREIRFSPDGRRLAYTARKGNKWLMVVDGEESPLYDDIREPYYSLDSKHICYVAFRNKKSIVVIDGKESPAYAGISMHFPYVVSHSPFRRVEDGYCPVVFASNGRTAYIASNGRDGNGVDQDFLVVDGKPGSVYDGIRAVEFSPDGSRIAYVAVKGEKEFVVDDKEGPKFDQVQGTLVFSPDSKRLAYFGTRYDANSDPLITTVLDGKEGSKYSDVFEGSLIFSPDSKQLGYVATIDMEKYFVVYDGKPGQKYDEIGGWNGAVFLTFTPKGQPVYRARQGDKYVMVIDGVPSPAFDEVSPYLIYSPDGAHHAYYARENDRALVVTDGVKGKAYATVYEESMGFTADGRIVYQASNPNQGGYFAVVGGEEFPDRSRPVVSPDGQHIAFLVDRKEHDLNKSKVEFAGAESGRFMNILQCSFHPDGTLEFLAVRDESSEQGLSQQLYRVTAK